MGKQGDSVCGWDAPWLPFSLFPGLIQPHWAGSDSGRRCITRCENPRQGRTPQPTLRGGRFHLQNRACRFAFPLEALRWIAIKCS